MAGPLPCLLKVLGEPLASRAETKACLTSWGALPTGTRNTELGGSRARLQLGLLLGFLHGGGSVCSPVLRLMSPDAFQGGACPSCSLRCG